MMSSKATEIVKNDISYKPDDLFWNERHTALIAALFTILIYSPRGVQAVLEQTPAQVFEFLESNVSSVGNYLKIFDGDSNRIKHQAARNVIDILERISLFDDQNEFLN